MNTTYTRRMMLIATGVVCGFAGCSTNDEQTSQRASETADNNDDDELSFFREYLINEQISIEVLSQHDQTIELVYATDRTTDEELGDEIGTIAGGYILAIDEGFAVKRLDAIISDGEDALASWFIDEEWIKEFRKNELPPDAFMGNVLDTVELVENSA